jgi:hypothetical protein
VGSTGQQAAHRHLVRVVQAFEEGVTVAFTAEQDLLLVDQGLRFHTVLGATGHHSLRVEAEMLAPTEAFVRGHH